MVASAQTGEIVGACAPCRVRDNVVTVEELSAGMTPGESTGHIAGFDRLAQVRGDAIGGGSHRDQFTADRIGDQATPAGIW